MSVPEKSFEPEAACPLDGVRVIDMSRLVSGNMVSLQLGDFGAEVVKIEDPKRGDPLRAWQTDGVSVHWKVYSRNKKSLAMSLREARGRELFFELLATAQVLIENFRPGTLEAMGFAPEVLHRQNPRLVILRVSGWGQDGPYRDRPGFGTLVESMSGYASRTGFPDPRFRTNSDRVRHAEACEAPIVDFTGARTLAENMEIFERAEVTAAPVYDIDQFMADPHVTAREILVDLPDAEIGRLPMHNVIPRLSQTPGRLRRPPPPPAHHTPDTLASLALDPL